MKQNACSRALAGFVSLSILAPIIGCGRPEEPVAAGPPSGPYNRQPQSTGMSTRKKLALLAGAAALIYLYNKHKNAIGTGAQGKYYLSKNGRVYYRDAQGNPVWVTPPREGIPVTQEEADFYRRAAQNRNWNAAYRPVTTPSPMPSMPPMPMPGRAPSAAPPGPPGPGR